MKYHYKLVITFLFSLLGTFVFSQNPTDACGAGVQVLTSNGACVTTNYTLPGGYANGGVVNASCVAGQDRDDGWYRFVATGTTSTVSVTGDQARVVAIFTGSCGTGELACDAQPAGATATAIAATTVGVTYYIQVQRRSGNNNVTMTGTVCVYGASPPPGPANDECSGAIALTVNPDNLCGTTTPGTINLATASAQNTASCGGTEDDDVWYSFVATGTTHLISLLNVAGSTTDLYHSVWSGACPALTVVAGSCSDPNSSTVTGLTPGLTYFVRVYSWTATTGQTSTFDICIGTPPPPPANDECGGAIPLTVNPDQLCGTVTTSTIASATASAQNPASCGGTEDDDVWFSFVATSSQHYIDLTNIVGGTTDLYHSVWEGVCPALTLVAGTCSDPNSSTVTGLTPGNTYYVRVYSWTATTGQTSVFDICIGSDAAPTCIDGIQNQGETGIDCGGPCPACPPPSCIDGIQNQGETGIDCGGPCPACPPILIPAACSNVTYNLTTLSSVSFYDDGGIGGDPCADAVGINNYCNCNCFTTVTINAAPGEYIVADFNEFAMWNTTSGWDWMKIYDGPNTGSPIMYDNSATGLDNPFGDCGIGATVMNFCSTQQSMTFEFWATSVVNRAGWDALVTSVVTPCVVPLPIDLANFTATCSEDNVALNWITATEKNNDYFTIEKSTNGVDFNPIDFIDGAGTSTIASQYRYVDYELNNEVAYYRIKQTDFDGAYSYSEVIASKCNMDGDVRIYPNPTTGDLFIEIGENMEGLHTIVITNVIGNVITDRIEISKETESYQVKDFTALNSGIYFIQIMNNLNEVVKFQKVVKQ